MGEFPIFNTKKLSSGEKYNLNDSDERAEYFKEKAGKEIEDIKNYLDNGNTFVAFLLAKKAAGKGTVTRLLMEALGEKRMAHISVGDIVRDVNTILEENSEEKEELMNFLKENYRGHISLDEAIDALLGRSVDKHLPTELILAMVKYEIEEHKGKAIFMDGFPRNLDQVSYSLYFREIMNLRDDPDFFVLIQVPETVIEERLSARGVCPKCGSPRNKKLFPSKYVEYDKEEDEVYFLCDDPSCEGCGEARLIEKEGDALGLEAIRQRLDSEGNLMDKASSLHGVPSVYLRNDIPVEKADKMIDEYEITPAYSYEVEGDEVEVKEDPWIIKSDSGVDSYSLLLAALAVSLAHQVHDILFESNKS